MCLQLFNYDTMSVVIYMLDDSTLYIRTLMPQISILQIPLRSHWAFPSPVSTLIREYSPKNTLANPELSRHASTILYRWGCLFARSIPRSGICKWNLSMSVPDIKMRNSTSEYISSVNTCIGREALNRVNRLNLIYFNRVKKKIKKKIY